jgi:NADPH:quinone reductase-like Zn-dependent oxidoreductase
MKAACYYAYGPPEVIGIEDVETPTPADDEVLVRVHAAAANAWDWDLLTGAFLIRALGAPRRPQYRVLGADVAGTVEAVGKRVTRFRPGDAVFGDLCKGKWGAFAEYVCAPESALTSKPDTMTFEQAASLPQAGVLALQGIRDYGRVRAGQKVLVNGAGGGVGTFAVQIAKSLGAEVTGVDRTEKLALVRSVGADHVVDYTRDDFTRGSERYDVILDVVGLRSMFDYLRALAPDGTYLMIGAPPARILQLLLLQPLLRLVGRKGMRLVVHRANASLDDLADLFDAGKLVPVIDGPHALRDLPAALGRLGRGEILGKLVVTP